MVGGGATLAGVVAGAAAQPQPAAHQRPAASARVTGGSATGHADPSFRLLEGTASPAVRDLRRAQRTLRDLGYRVRKLSGTVDTETRHALVAFQKVHGLERTGSLDEATAHALVDPVTPKARSRAAGFHLEVDLGAQVAYTVVDGEVRRIYDVSTGREPDRATPAGRFEVLYQIDGVRHAPLGPLYRPSYFTYDGIALHGGEPVPPWPASNGCVRLTDADVDELFHRLTPGTTVLVHRS